MMLEVIRTKKKSCAVGSKLPGSSIYTVSGKRYLVSSLCVRVILRRRKAGLRTLLKKSAISDG